VAEIVSCIQKAYRIEKFYVNDSFPIGFADQLRKLRVPFEIRVGRIAERAVKSEAEVEALREASRVAALGMRFAEDAFRKAIVKNGILFLDNAPLTSERVITGIEMTCLEHGGLASHTIVAGGIQASQPHCTGFGPLPANAFIVVDIFPRIKKTGYFGDLSRTFFKGKPSEEQRKLIETVQKAQKMAIESLKPGRDGREIYYKVCDFFASEGYVTDLTGTSQRTDITNLVDSSLQPAGKKGFIHSLGHGVGLEIHEAPSLGKRASAILKPNMVFTIEPGLYYPKQHLGGVRIEDVICLRESGPEMLSNYPYEWEV
jgi:Xaa-Pro aminopeptidase